VGARPGGCSVTHHPERGLGYARISRPDEKVILDNQVLAIKSHADRLGISLEDVLKETASGGKDDRAELTELLRRAESPGGPKLVIFTSLSRMTRGGVASALYVLNRLERAGVGWHFTDQPILNFDASTPKMVKDIILAVLAAVDEDYRRNISAKTKAAFSRRKALAEARGDKVRWGRPPGSKNRKSGTPVTLSEQMAKNIAPISGKGEDPR
jgi:DNA invertase Pin-like site-specific DNA recombinase